MAIPVMRACWVTLAVLLLASHSHARNITNEDIRDAVLALVHMFRTSEDKLERHEYREKALGEQLKKMMTGLEKKHRALEPLKGMISRLDDRIYNVENIFLQKEEKEKVAHTKTNEVLEAIQTSLKSLADYVMNNIKPPVNKMAAGDALTKRLDATDAKLDDLKTEIASLKNNLNKDALRAMCLEVASDVNPLERHITEAEKLLNKYELKLNEYGNATKVQTDFVPLSEISLADDAWHSKMTEVMERQENEIHKIQRLLGDAESMWKDLPRLADLNRHTNQTLEGVNRLQKNLAEIEEKSVAKMSSELRDMGRKLLETNKDIQKSLTDGNEASGKAYSDIQRSYMTLSAEIQTFGKYEHQMLQIADKMEAMKKSIEYETYQIMLETRELTRGQSNLLNQTIAKRFDNIESTIISNQKESFKNLSGKIESEMQSVWRQIGIMYQQLTVSKTAIDKLNEQTAQYVNGSAIALNSIQEKVGKITTSTLELDDNLNYLLGRLSLVTQEFQQIKAGLGNALEEAKLGFRDVNKEIAAGASTTSIRPVPHASTK